jgi:hypothetical protein
MVNMGLVRGCPALWQDTWPTLFLLDTEGMSVVCDRRGLGSYGIFLGRLSDKLYDRPLPWTSPVDDP